MICVTGAGGTVSSELIKELESAKAPFRAAYFSKKGSSGKSVGEFRFGKFPHRQK
jgi:aspartate-semialdehyde dehydrogenase